MNFISIMAVTHEVARAQAISQTGYAPDTFGPAVFTADQGNNSRQQEYVFETGNDVTKHPLYVHAMLSDNHDLAKLDVHDGPLLMFGPEVTVGG